MVDSCRQCDNCKAGEENYCAKGLARVVLCAGSACFCVLLGMGQNEATRGLQVLVHVSIYQGNPFWVLIFDPQSS